MYQALYRKYRPQTFDEVAGQTAITQTLRNQVATGRLSHAYLFTGTRGTGKTSCAKILAKAVNCLQPVDGNPCNECSACRGIDSGAVMDVQEIDAASNNGVDNVRTIRDDAVYPPVEVKKRVYIIDEVHMLSASAFNALLKTIEEPPEHLMFILATTELNKVPATILSRCQRFAFRRPTAEDITAQIRYVAWQENIDLSDDAAELLGRLADGAFRDGLSLLDQCAGAVKGAMTVEDVYRVLGLAGQRQTVALMEAIAARNAAEALTLFSELYAAGKDAAALLGELSALSRDLLVVKTAPKSGMGMLSTTCTAKEISALAPRFTAEELLRMVSLITEATLGFRNSLNPRVDAELCLIHLCDPALSQDPADLSARISRVEGTLSDKLALLEQRLRSGELIVAAESAEAPAEERPTPVEDVKTQEPDVPPKQEMESDSFWEEVLRKVLPEIDVAYRSTIQQIKGRRSGDTLTLALESTPFASGALGQAGGMEKIREKAAVVAGKAIRVRVQNAGGEADPMQSLQRNFGDKDNIQFIR